MIRSSAHDSLAGRVLYGSVFAIVLPGLLVLWAHATRGVVHGPVVHDPRGGAMAAAAGVLIALAGMAALWKRGGGLPMNAFPPPHFVASGIYAAVPHPIYGGFIVACAGVAVSTGSAGGLWLVTPAVTLGCAALVLGHEMPDLRSRFGATASAWLPAIRPGAPTLLERLRIYLVILLPWFAGYELLCALGLAPDSMSTWTRLDKRVPIIEASELVYASVYVVVLLAPLIIRSASALRRFAWLGLAAMAVIFPLYLLLPFYASPRPFYPATVFAPLLLLERQPGSEAGAFPSFHVVWACIAASALGEGARSKRVVAWTWAILVAASCATTGMHSLADIVAGFAAFLLVVNLPAIWKAILAAAERIANSWREWRIGPVRIINHGAYAGAGAGVGMVIIDAVTGPGRVTLGVVLCICTLIGAALWAQWVEGSPALLRPLGFYGGLLGAIAGASVFALETSFWTVLAALALAAPWIQALGRLRCLVQGCCHGRAAESVPGIRYTHPRSRVCRLAHLAGIPVHATPVYSILWNVLVGAALLRLAQIGASSAFLCRVYLLLSGCGRFVEEAYRGEPQTRLVAGLRFYQWMAVACVVAGAAMTCVGNSPPLPAFSVRPASILLGLACGLLTWFVSGVDFPESNRRFARLT
ncbi:MAG TPA: prolipoprotein diacylglyceryl transferase family protein [Candidatus Sulfopaludibacter sp.]|nr:prolipoprotein diacylglyceryl transferase family protein [Candidatus Sulfopaludibacter sp.]